jgi:hypothetical protein
VKPRRTRPPRRVYRKRPRPYAVGPLFVAAGACIAAAFLCWGCGGDGGGGRGAPGRLEEIPAGEYDKIVQVEESSPGDYSGTGDASGSGTGGTGEARKEYRRAGTLSGKGDSDSFDVIAEYEQVDVVFAWPEGQVDFWVKAYGQEGDELGDFDLDNGDIIQLLNGGKFTVEFYSKKGSGSWSATYEN